VGWGYDTRRFVPVDVARLDARDVPRLKLKWAIGFPSALRARSQPVVAMGAVFVGSQDGTIYALDLTSGCARWTSRVSAEVRTAIVVEPRQAGTKPTHSPRLFFGDLLGHVYAMDALTGKLLWRQRPDDHANATITGTPVVHGDTLIVPISSLEVVTVADPNYGLLHIPRIGGRAGPGRRPREMEALHGRASCRADRHHHDRHTADGASGRTGLGQPGLRREARPHLSWQRGKLSDPRRREFGRAVRGRCAHRPAPLALPAHRRRCLEQHLRDEGSPELPAREGTRLRCLSLTAADRPGRRSPGGVVGQKSGMVYAVDPDTGKPIWSQRVGRGGIQGGIHFGMAADGATLFVGITDLTMQSDGSGTREAGFPGVHALDARTGKFLWRTVVPNECGDRKYCDPGVSAAVTAMPGAVFAGHLDGKLRAYDSATGKIIWEVDTTPAVKTVNGATAHGGSISGPGAAIADGHVIINSGYGFSYHMPGNVMLVYTDD